MLTLLVAWRPVPPRGRGSPLQRMFLLGPNRGLRNKHNKWGRLKNQDVGGLPLPPSA